MEPFQESEIEESFEEIGQLAEPFVRELRIVAGLPGRATMPLTGKRRDTKASRPTCDRLLGTTESLANMLHPPAGTPDVPDTVCAPEGLGPYLRVLWWFLADEEQVRAIAFPYEAGEHNLMGVVPPILAKRIDATWDALTLGRAAAIVERLASSTFVAVTDRRIVTAKPRKLLRQGQLDVIIPLDEARHVCPRAIQYEDVRSTASVITERNDIKWMFPAVADNQQIDRLAAVIGEDTAGVNKTQLPIEQFSKPSPEKTVIENQLTDFQDLHKPLGWPRGSAER